MKTAFALGWAAARAAALAWLVAGCADDRVAGGGTETGNAGVVSGRILDSDGRGVASALVNLEEVETAADGSDGGSHYAAQTDAQGKYRFEKVEAGRYALYSPPSDGRMQAAILTRLEMKDSLPGLPDAVARQTVTLEGRVLPSPSSTGGISDVVVCVPGMRSCVSPGEDSVWRFALAPKGAYEILFLTASTASYLAVQVRAETGSTIYFRDVALSDSADATHLPYRFYDLPQTHSFSVAPRSYPAGEEPAWYAGKAFADVKYLLLSETGAATVWNPDYLADWKYVRTFDGDSLHTGADLAQPLAGFPLPIRLTAADFDFTQARTDGSDIVFSDSTGRLLPFEIERWDAAAKRGDLWVRLDALAAAKGDRKILMHWGNAAAVPRSAGARVFQASEGFIGVWHFLESDGAPVAEARGLFPGALIGPVPAGGLSALRTQQGAVGPALVLGKSGEYVHVPNQTALDVSQTFTVSIWARVDQTGTARKQLLASKWQVNRREWHFAVQADRTFEMEFGDSAGVIQGTWRSKTPVASPEAWHLYGAVFDKGTVKLYLDGVESAGAINSGSIPSAVNRFKSDVNIGSNSIDTTLNWQGSLDEFHYFSTAKSKDWMDMSFRTQKPRP